MRVLIVPNTAKPQAVSAAAELAVALSAAGLEPLLVDDDAEASGLSAYSVSRTAVGTPGLVVALGGDGTILKAVHLLGDVEAPVLGVNFGRLGFMTGTAAEHMREAVERALAGEACIERRMTLRAEVMIDGRVLGVHRALNETFIGRGTSGRVVPVEVLVDGHAVAKYSCDGVIVATPTGSTAYALSAGGPIVAPGVPGIIVVPVAPHSLSTRPLVLEASRVVEVRIDDPARSEACVSVDGETVPCRRGVGSVVLSRAEHDVLLVRPEGSDFVDVASSKFFGR